MDLVQAFSFAHLLQLGATCLKYAMATGSSGSSHDELQASLTHLTPKVAKRVAQMSILNPEVLRVTPAYRAFQKCGGAFRNEGTNFHQKSRRSEEITRFWSHSWHGSDWQKILTLLVLYNGLASILLGTLAAFAMMWLFALGFLPGFTRFDGMMVWSTWSLATGLVVSIASFVLWRPQEEVFFDRLCINEEDGTLKGQAILSLAGMLKNPRKCWYCGTQAGAKDCGVCLSWQHS